MSPIEILLLIVVFVMLGAGIWLGSHLLTQHGRFLMRIEALEQQLYQEGVLRNPLDPSNMGRPAGSVLNDFALPALSGGTVTLSQWRGRRVALIYLSPTCKYCEQILPDLASAIAQGQNTDPMPLIIASGSADENRRFFGDRFSCPILLQEDSEVSSLHMVMVTPMGYLVDENGVTVGPPAVGGSAVLDFFHGKAGALQAPSKGHSNIQPLANSQIKRDGLKAGTVAPSFTLPTLDGNEIALESFRGKPLLLVFSDPDCRPCSEVLPKLNEIYGKSQDLEMLVISRGDPEANRKKVKELRLTLPLVLQKSWEISRAYAMFATPIGYLIGEDGVLTSDVVAGGNAILALVAQQQKLASRAAVQA